MKNLLQGVIRYPKLVWIRALGEFLTGFTGSMLTPFLIFYLQDKLGGSIVIPMLIVGLQPLADICVTVLGGNLADRFGRKPIILIALFLQSLAMVGFVWAESAWMFAGLYALNGVGRSLFIPAQRAQIADAVPEQQRAEVFALLSSIGYVSVSVGPFFGMLAYKSNPAILFILEALALFCYALIVWKWVPETVMKKTGSIPDSLSVTHSQANSPTKSFSHRALSFISEYRNVLGLMLFSLPISFFYAQVETNFPLHLKNSFPDYLSVVASMTSVKAVLAICLQFWLVKTTGRLPTHQVILLSYGCFLTTGLIYGLSDVYWFLLVAQLFLVVGESVGLTRLLQLVSTIAPPDKRGRYFSLYGMHWDISRTVGPVLGSFVLMQQGGMSLFILASVLLLVGCLAQFFWVKRMVIPH